MKDLYERALDCLDVDDGSNEKVFVLLMDLILEQYGEEKASEFSRQIDATDGCFYLRNSNEEDDEEDDEEDGL